jgi:hypothetical protein
MKRTKPPTVYFFFLKSLSFSSTRYQILGELYLLTSCYTTRLEIQQQKSQAEPKLKQISQVQPQIKIPTHPRKIKYLIKRPNTIHMSAHGWSHLTTLLSTTYFPRRRGSQELAPSLPEIQKEVQAWNVRGRLIRARGPCPPPPKSSDISLANY